MLVDGVNSARTGHRDLVTATETASATQPLTEAALASLDAWWRAANYLSVGQIYLLDDPLLRRPLQREDIKPRLLGHWGTTPGLNLLWAHLNRLIRERDVVADCRIDIVGVLDLDAGQADRLGDAGQVGVVEDCAELREGVAA